MTSFATDVHATIDEIANLLEGWVDQYRLELSAFAFPPNRQVPITRQTLRDVLNQPDVCSVVVTTCSADPSWKQAHDATISGFDMLRFEVGRLGPFGLTQSSLSTPKATPTWAKLNRELKKLTTAGATLDCANGVQGIDRNARFTAGAKALHASGVPLRQMPNSTKFVYVPK